MKHTMKDQKLVPDFDKSKFMKRNTIVPDQMIDLGIPEGNPFKTIDEEFSKAEASERSSETE